MKFSCSLLICAAAFCSTAWAQASDKSQAAAMETLIKKIDEQNMKIDALSQQILKLEQQVSSIRPGVIIGDATPSAATAPSAAGTAAGAAAPAPAPVGAGNAHVVAKGETLISIAKANKVGVDELQKFNHIEDARKLQAGQTIMIPAPGASPATSPSPSPSPGG
jgi:LysM repeat protein